MSKTLIFVKKLKLMPIYYHLLPKFLNTSLLVFVLPFLVLGSNNGNEITQPRAVEPSIDLLTNNPFRITYPGNDFKIWYIGFNYTIKWDQGDNNTPVELAENVNIKLSLDDGKTFPITLAANVPNDGSHEIKITRRGSGNAKILVQGIKGSFEAESEGILFIQKPMSYILVGGHEKNTCDSTKKVSYLLSVQSSVNDTSVIEITVLSKPDNLELNITQPRIISNGQTDIIVKNFKQLPHGKYNIEILITSPFGKDTLQLVLYKSNSTFLEPTIVSPLNGSSEVKDTVVRWNAIPGIERYKVYFSDKPDFRRSYLFSNTSDTFFNITRLEIQGNDIIYWWVNPVSSCYAIPENRQFNSFSLTKSNINILSIRPVLVTAGSKATLDRSNLFIADAITKDFNIYIRKLPKYGNLFVDNELVKLNDVIPYSLILNYSLNYRNFDQSAIEDELVVDVANDLLITTQLVVIPIYIRSKNFNAFAFASDLLQCPGDMNGTITTIAYDGKSPYKYSLSNGMTNNNGIFSKLPSGQYSITVTDANGLSKINEVSISEPPTFSAMPELDKYKILPNIQGEETNYEIKLNNRVFKFPADNKPIQLYYNDIYTITITSDRGCKISQTFILNVPPLEGKIELISPPLCSDGLYKVRAEAIGGFAPYSYFNRLGELLDSIIYMTIKENYIYVIDSGGKREQIGPINLPIVPRINFSYNLSNSVLTFSASGGKAPYSYSLDGINYTATDTLLIKSAGTIKIYLRDANGCEETKSFFINYFSQVSKEIRNVSCAGKQDGRVILTAANGLFPFEYSFEGSTFSEIRIFDNLAAGAYNYKVKDSNNDTIIGVVSVIEPDTLELDVMIASNNATAIVTGGTPPYRYSIDNGDVFIDGNEFSELPNGSFTIIVRDKNGCTDSLAILINSTLDVLGNDIRLYPNPTTDVLTLDVSQYEYQTLSSKIVSVEGKEIDIAVKKENSRWIFNTQTLIPGFYILEVTLDGKVLRRSFVKR